MRYKDTEENKICSILMLLDPCLEGQVFRSLNALSAAKHRLLELANQEEDPESINEEVGFLFLICCIFRSSNTC